MTKLPRTCTLKWNDEMEASTTKTQLNQAVKRTMRKKYKHCLARGSRPTIEVKENYYLEPYVAVKDINWGRQLSCKELGIPKLVKEIYIHNKHLTATTEAGVRQYLKDNYKHFVAKDAKLKITPFGILTKVSNIKWGRQVASTELQ